MTNDAADSQLLAQEDWSIQRLARQTHMEIDKVRTMYLIEYKKLAVKAHITAFLPLLTSNCVRGILDAQNLDAAAVAVAGMRARPD